MSSELGSLVQVWCTTRGPFSFNQLLRITEWLMPGTQTLHVCNCLAYICWLLVVNVGRGRSVWDIPIGCSLLGYPLDSTAGPAHPCAGNGVFKVRGVPIHDTDCLVRGMRKLTDVTRLPVSFD